MMARVPPKLEAVVPQPGQCRLHDSGQYDGRVKGNFHSFKCPLHRRVLNQFALPRTASTSASATWVSPRRSARRPIRFPFFSMISVSWCSISRRRRGLPRSGGGLLPLDGSRQRRCGLDLVTQPCQPSPKGSSGRPVHRSFRGLPGVHSHYSPHMHRPSFQLLRVAQAPGRQAAYFRAQRMVGC
jgi:hypothetical protein